MGGRRGTGHHNSDEWREEKLVGMQHERRVNGGGGGDSFYRQDVPKRYVLVWLNPPRQLFSPL